jgi:hypothetical protein
MSEVKTTITMAVTHPNHPTMCPKGSQHEVLYSYSNGFDIRIKKEVSDTVYPYVQVFIPRDKCSINQTV